MAKAALKRDSDPQTKKDGARQAGARDEWESLVLIVKENQGLRGRILEKIKQIKAEHSNANGLQPKTTKKA